MQLLSRNEVVKRTSLSRATLFRKERAGQFPKAVRISANRVAYDADAVDAWIAKIIEGGHESRDSVNDGNS